MGRSASRTRSYKQKQTQPTKYKSNLPDKNSTNNTNPSVASTIGQGMSLGAGAAIGNAAVNGIFNSLSGSSNNDIQHSNQSNQNSHEKNNDLSFKCDRIVNSFNECIQNNNTNCHLYLDTFKECFENRI